MTVVLTKKHFSLNEKLAKESNIISRNFNIDRYLKIKNIDAILLKRDISVEKKKKVLMKELHESIANAFSIDKEKLNKKVFESLKKRLNNIRRTIIKLRTINYYLETAFLEELKTLKIKAIKDSKLRTQNTLARDELEALEFTTYKLIEEVVMLDKRLLKEYNKKAKMVISEGKVEIKDFEPILKKQSELLEHLEAKLPPSKAASIVLLKEPVFTHWVARIFALLSYLEHIYYKEIYVFSKLKKNKLLKIKINKKIVYLVREKSKLINVMEEKASSMKKFGIDDDFKKELHQLTTTIAL